MEKKKHSRAMTGTILSILLTVVLAVTVIPPVQSEASAKSKALTQYKRCLSGKRVCVLPRGVEAFYDRTYDKKYYSSPASRIKFYIGYIDGDNIPDLVLYDSLWGYGVWTYIGKSFRCLKWEDSFAVPVGYYYKKGVFRENEYSEGTYYRRNYFKVKTGRWPSLIQHVACDSDGAIGAKRFYVGSRNVSSSKFYKNLKKYTGKTKMTQIPLHWNNAGNREKYIK